MRGMWLVIGVLAAVFGIAGIVLPLVPTTPFLLVAAFAFARSSPRLHGWLVSHPRLGPPIHAWRAHGAISRANKRWAVAVMLAALALSLVSGAPSWLIVLQAVVLAGSATFVLSRPDGPRRAG